jgi:glycosyltransferase involved in cell wall biosynthesis
VRVVFSTISRFHTFNLARRMERFGVLERVFTGLPRWKVQDEGLPPEKVSTFPYFQTVFEGMGRFGMHHYPLKTELNWWCHQTLDRHVARNLPTCDVLHALSYCGLESGREAQRRGAVWVCDVVNSHLGYQDDVLAEEFERVGLPYTRQDQRFLEYATASYEGADMITVPSTFARESFLERGVPDRKLALIPFGVDLERFRPLPTARDDTFRVLYVGQIAVRKGIHDLMEAFRLAAIPSSELVLVGTPLPEFHELARRMPEVHVQLPGPQPAARLPEYYSAADVLVLPSIEDGFGYVIAEAMACGCAILATTHTGGPDLVTDGREGFIVPPRSPQALAEKLVWLFEHSEERETMRQAALDRVQSFGGWDSYSERMFSHFEAFVDHVGRR